MPEKKNRTVWCTYTIVCLGVLTAMTVVLARVLAIPVGGFGRFTLGSLCTVMAGLWFGPAAGALCGFTADILGCILQGYAVNPLITIGAMLWGVIPVLVMPAGDAKTRQRVVRLTLGVILAGIVCSLGFTYAGLVLILGFDFYAILPTRLVQFTVMTAVYCVLANLLYFSPVTAMVRRNLAQRKRRAAVI